MNYDKIIHTTMMHQSKKSSPSRFGKKRSPKGQRRNHGSGEKKSREINVDEIFKSIDKIYNPELNIVEYSEDGLVEAKRLYTMHIAKVKKCIAAQTKVLSPDINVIINLITICFKESISTNNYAKKTLCRLLYIKQKPMIDKYVKHVFNTYAERNEIPTSYEDILEEIRINDAERSRCPKHHYNNNHRCKCILGKLNDCEILLGVYTRAATYKCGDIMVSLYDNLSKQKEYDDKKLTAWHCVFWGAKGQPHNKENVMQIVDVIKNGPYMPILLKNDKGETGIDSLLHNDNLSMDDRLEIYDHVMMLNKKEALKIFMGISNKITDRYDEELAIKCTWVLVCQPESIINEIASIIMKSNVSPRIEKSKNIENVIRFVNRCLSTNHHLGDDQLKMNRFFEMHEELICTLKKDFPLMLLQALHDIDTSVHGMAGEYAANKLNDRMISISMGIGELNKYDDSIFEHYFAYLMSRKDSIFIKMMLYSVCQAGVRDMYVIEGFAQKYKILTDNKLKFSILDWFDNILGKGSYDIDSIVEGTVDTAVKTEETKAVEKEVEVDDYGNQDAVIRMVHGSKSAKTERDIADTIDDVKYSIEKQVKKKINCLNYPYEMFYSYCELYDGTEKNKYMMNVLPCVLKSLVDDNVFTNENIIESFNKLTKDNIDDIKIECPRVYDVIEIFNSIYGKEIIKFKKKKKVEEMKEEMNYGSAIRDNLPKVKLVPREYKYYFDSKTMQIAAVDTITRKSYAMVCVNVNGVLCWRLKE